MEIYQAIGNRAGEGATLNNISQIHDANGDYNKSFQYLEQSLKVRQAIRDIPGVATTLNNMGAMLFEQNRPEEAVPLLMKAYQIFQKIGSPDVHTTESWLDKIIQKIGEARFQEIVASLK
ncbi:MAG: tetratricopeptide repeat protein [Lewinellaceae bacterium]|nr:tetratricopeptide repeat protein [Lewinellaceae bacterium]